VPWYLWAAALAVTSGYVGGYWDISWHRSIGRDTFWTAPHLAIYACGVLAGISSGYLILTATFERASLLIRHVRMWGLSGPLGLWPRRANHQPPHMVLAAGFLPSRSGPSCSCWHS
jgi:hypothetical protein